MTGKWSESIKLSQEPYGDWERRRRAPIGTKNADNVWRSVSLRMTGSKLIFLENLEKLRDFFVDGQFSDLPGIFGETIEISDDEFVFLDELSRGLRDRVNAIADEKNPDYGFIDEAYHRFFFVYMREDVIESDISGFLPRETYEVVYISPPIPSLNDTSKGGGGRTPKLLFSSETGTSNAILGLIDDGIAFAHENFRTRDRKETRIEWLWLQSQEARSFPPSNLHVQLGTRLSKLHIDALLQAYDREQDLYRAAGALDMGTGKFQPLAYRASHGTHVLDLMGGLEPAGSIGTQVEDADFEKRFPIFAVQLPPEATEDTSGETMGSYVLQAVRQLMVWADLKHIAATKAAIDSGESPPDFNTLVINFSYGILAGPKDGQQLLEKLIDELIEARRNSGRKTFVVLPSGNSYDSRTTAMMEIEKGGTQFVDWIVHPDDRTSSFLEIWTDSADVSLSLFGPGGAEGSALETNKGTHTDHKVNVLEVAGRPVASIVDDLRPDGRRRIFIAVGPTKLEDNSPAAPSGAWRIQLSNAGECADVSLYIQRDDTPAGFTQRGRQSYFEHPDAFGRDPKTGDYLNHGGPVTNEGSLSAIATGAKTTVVGAATDALSNWGESDGECRPSPYTSSGPTPGREAPDFAAIADTDVTMPGVLAAGTYSGSVVAISGTSVAAPQVARSIALNVSAEKQEVGAGGPHPRLGRGLYDVRRLDKVLRRKF